MGLVPPVAKQGVEWVTKAEETGVNREWAFDVPLLTCVKVMGLVGEGDIPDGSCRSCGIASLGEYLLQVSLDVFKLGLRIHGPKGPDGFSHGNTLKGVWGDVGQSDGKT